jgi:hypothetical protein
MTSDRRRQVFVVIGATAVEGNEPDRAIDVIFRRQIIQD